MTAPLESSGRVQVRVGGVDLTLLPEKAAWIASQRTLLVADAHIGKAVSFRRLGVPVPRGTTGETLAVLDGLIERLGAARIVFLGDFLHSARSLAAGTLDAVTRWRAWHPGLTIVLVRGNHDAHAGDPPPALGFEVVDEPYHPDGVGVGVGGGGGGGGGGALALCHHPRARPGCHVVAGHLHPCVTLGGPAHDRLRLACFQVGPQVTVLPAFGSFTGMHPVRPAPGDRLFVVADGVVRAIASADSQPINSPDG